MRAEIATFVAGFVLCASGTPAQSGGLTIPNRIEAGAAFSIQAQGSGKATLYIAGPGQIIKRELELGQPVSIEAGALYAAGNYSVWVTSDSSSQEGSIEVLPAEKPSDLTFIAKPSRLQVALHNGITGTVYVFDTYGNLIVRPNSITFELSNPSAGKQTRTVETRNGAAWTEMDSTTREGKAEFIARVAGVSSTRVVGQVPGDPCSLKMNAKAAGKRIELVTDPVRDCSGNAVPDGTIVTFTEVYENTKSTVDVPLKKSVATVQMPAYRGATISVASGVVLGNQIRWQQ